MRRLILLTTGSLLLAGDPVPRAWSDTATLSFVATDGNAQGQTFGFANEYGYKWALTSLSVKVAAVRASSSITTRTATGEALDSAVVTEHRTTSTTAEMYTFGARLDHRLKAKDRFYGFVAANWERNRPAGLDGRSGLLAGGGRVWLADGPTSFRTDLGLGWTYEQPLVLQPGFRQHYGTVTLNALLTRKFGAASLYSADLTLLDNLSDTADWQGVLKQGLTVKLNAKFALKVGYDVAYRSRPNLIPVDVTTAAPVPVNLGKVSVPARKTDSLFTTSLVVTF